MGFLRSFLSYSNSKNGCKDAVTDSKMVHPARDLQAAGGRGTAMPITPPHQTRCGEATKHSVLRGILECCLWLSSAWKLTFLAGKQNAHPVCLGPSMRRTGVGLATPHPGRAGLGWRAADIPPVPFLPFPAVCTLSLCQPVSSTRFSCVCSGRSPSQGTESLKRVV